MTSRETSRRLTVQEAAEVLETTVDAVRMRVRRGSLESEKDSDGRVYVYLDADSSGTKPRPNGEGGALLEAKDETIAILRDQLHEEREARRRADTIIAQLTQANAALAARVPELEAAESSEDRSQGVAEGQPATATTPPASRTEGPRVSWWRRMFGG